MEYLVPAILAFLGGLALWYVKRERKELDYEIVASELFPHGARTGKYHVIRLRNSGTVAIEHAQFTVTFEQGSIESSRWSDDRLVANVSTEESKLECVIPLLNPRERIALTVTTVGDHELSSPKVDARAIGVTATARSESTSAIDLNVLTVVTSAAVLSIAVVTFWTSGRQADIQQSITTLTTAQPGVLSDLEKRTSELEQTTEKQNSELEQILREESQGKPDSPEIIFSILNRAGVGHLTNQLVVSGQEISYWGTGLLIVDSFLLDQDNGRKYVSALEELVRTPGMAASREILIKLWAFR